MNTFHSQNLHILILFLLCIITTADEEPEELSRNYRFHEYERPCSFRRQQGVCRKQSLCNKPSRHVCRFGFDRIICCLDEPELMKPPSTAATKRPVSTERPLTTRRPSVKPDSFKAIDLSFPGCGFRIPDVKQSPKPSNGRLPNNRGGGLFSRLGKRSLHGKLSYSDRKRRRSVQHVIVGGVDASPNSWPWMVAIFKEIGARAPKRFLCGASLINRRYVMSAAHCFDGEKGNIDPSKFFIVVGSHTTKDGTEYPVQNILIHPDYKQRQYYNDISLLRVRDDVILTRKVYPVCLPSDGLREKIIPDNNNVTVTGWGDTSFGGVSSKVLQELTIPIVPLKECNTSYSKLLLLNFPRGVTNHFICAGVKEGGKDACQGDSGGPLVSKLKDNSFVQLGVVSFGYGCAQPGYPGVYTRVSQYIRWLYDNTDLGKS